MTLNSLASYWDAFYAMEGMRRIPSQFAAFVLNEFSDKTTFIDCGCGNGRDSFFFAAHQKNTIGVDASPVAIKKNQADAASLGMENLKFLTLDFSDPVSLHEFTERQGCSIPNAVLYARFFLHAINEIIEANFFDFCTKLMDETSVLCVEFRTEKDASRHKETAAHYRRFIGLEHVMNVAMQYGLKLTYSVEGCGYAKYRGDDAEVARMIFKKVSE